MKYLFVLASLAITFAYDISTSSNRCSCSNVNYQNDCSSLINCQWTGSACQVTNCTSLTLYSDCVLASLCAWVNNTCSLFTKCSDYSATANATCYVQGAGCNYTNTANATSPCTDFTATTTTTTTTTTIAACSTYTTNATCLGTGVGCLYVGTTCRVLGCSDYTTSATCTRVYSEDYKTAKICGWTSAGACAEASSLSVLNSTNCFSLTNGRASWNSASNVCAQCSSAFILLISLLGALLI